MIKVISLDLDGTLVDTLPIHRSAFCKAVYDLHKLKIDDTYHDQYLKGLPTVEKIKRLISFAELPKNIDISDLIERKNKYATLFIESLRPNQMLNKMLFEMSESYIFTCVTNTNKEFALMTLRNIHLHDLFDLIITGSDLKHLKPHKEPYLRLRDNYLLMEMKEFLIVEDSEEGCKSAKSAGFKNIWKVNGTTDVLNLKSQL